MGDFVELETNIPQTIAMAYDTGKKVETRFGDKIFFTLTDGRTLSVKPETADLIAQLGVGRNYPFCVCKREKKNGNKKIAFIDVWLPAKDEMPPSMATVAAPSHASQATGIPDTDLELEMKLRASLEEIERKKKAGASAVAPAPAPAAPIAQQTAQIHGNSNGHANGNGHANSNGTNGNGAPRPYAVAGIPPVPTKIPADIAFREVLQFVTSNLREAGEQWTDQAKQDMVSTIMIQSMRDGAVGIWQRGGAK